LLDVCLEKDRNERAGSMRELADELRALRRRLDRPESAPAAGPARQQRRPEAKLRVLIVDDEELARAVLREFLAKQPDVEILAECGNGFEAVKAASELRPDLVFLDIQMPKLNGFEVLELIDRAIGVVFVTAYDEFALKAFDVHALDYLLKPVAPERLAAALGRARERLGSRAPLPVAQIAAEAQPKRGHAERILVRQGARVHVIPAPKLDYAQAQDDYVLLRAEGKEHLKEQTLAELERTLDPARFVRIHRSYLLNIDRLSKLEAAARDSRVAILADGTRLPVSRAGYARLKSLL
jgi:two-component system LytT family response regulator